MSDEVRNTVLFYGLTPTQEDFIMKKVSNCDFRIAGCGTDLILHSLKHDEQFLAIKLIAH